MLTSIFRKLPVAALCGGAILGLAGCVSGSGDTTFKTDNGSISIALADPVTGATMTNISMSNAAKVVATVRDPSGGLVPNAVVTFATRDAALATIIPASGTALTNASGVASVQIIAASPTAAGATTISASTSVGGAALTISAGFGVLATNTGATGLSITLTNPLTGVTISNVSTGSPAKVTVTLRDTSGAVVPNTVVTFVTAATLASMIPSTGTALTDAAGTAAIQINPVNPTVAGATTITASALVGGAALSASAGFGIIPTSTGVTGTIQIESLPFNSIKTGDLYRVSATVNDAAGKAVPNTVVNFAVPASLLTMFPAAGSSVTDASGRASVQIASAAPTAAGAATITATATVGGTSISGSVNLNVVATQSAVGVTVVLTNPVSGAPVTNISPGSPAKVTATIRNAAGAGVPNTVVSFATTATLASMTPTTGTALTNSAGVASIQIDAASLTAAGATTVTASALVEGAAVSGNVGFSVSAANADLANMQVKTDPLSPYATTSVSVDVTGVPANTPVTINFSSICAGTGKASLPASVQTTSGTATATYTDKGCASNDTITASVAGLAVTKTITLKVDPPGPASIQFVSATPSTIVLKGTGGAGLVESSLVKFRVVDNNNSPIATGVNVTFDLTTRTGDILLDGVRTAVTRRTDANGEASVTVQSGTTPTAVWVNASLSGTSLTSQSNQLRISTGRPAQDRFTLSVGTHNIEGYTVNGVTTAVSVIASDRLGNPVPDGTAINFIAEGGQIVPSCATANGTCAVTFTSANPRPTSDTEPNGIVTKGRVSVVAYTLGEESFIDANANNKYDAGESFNDLGEVFINNNESVDSSGNPVWDAGEQSISFNSSNSQACNSGISASPKAPSKAGTCDGVWGQAHVRQSDVIVMSGSSGFVKSGAAPTASEVPGSIAVPTYPMGGVGTCNKVFLFYAFDQNKNPLPAGTTFATSSPPASLGSVTISPPSVGDSSTAGGTAHSIQIAKPSKTDATTGDVSCVTVGTGGVTLNVTMSTPKGTVSTAAFSITD